MSTRNGSIQARWGAATIRQPAARRAPFVPAGRPSNPGRFDVPGRERAHDADQQTERAVQRSLNDRGVAQPSAEAIEVDIARCTVHGATLAAAGRQGPSVRRGRLASATKV
jgi:hypothetical protein